ASRRRTGGARVRRRSPPAARFPSPGAAPVGTRCIPPRQPSTVVLLHHVKGGRLMTTGTAAGQSVLVSTDWVAQHRDDPNVRIVEVDVDTAAYDQGHIPGAVGWNWTTELCDTLVRDIIPKDRFEALMAR